MNRERRKEVRRIMARVEEITSELADLQADLETVMQEEEEYRDNMPENLQGSTRFQKADETCSYLEEAFDTMGETQEQLGEVHASLECAAE